MPLPTPALDVHPQGKAFFDPQSSTISYVVRDPGSVTCAIVDAVLYFDYAAGRLTHDSADAIIAHIRTEGLELECFIETHVHADRLSGAPDIQENLGGKIGIGERTVAVQDTFGKIFNQGTEFQRDGSLFDRLFSVGDAIP